jgi:hypothetical protein
MRETVLFKIDTGANVTLCDRFLYDHGVRMWATYAETESYADH